MLPLRFSACLHIALRCEQCRVLELAGVTRSAKRKLVRAFEWKVAEGTEVEWYRMNRDGALQTDLLDTGLFVSLQKILLVVKVREFIEGPSCN